MRRLSMLSIALLTLAAGCSSYGATTPGGPTSGTGLSATINGVNWAPAAKASATFTSGIFVVAGLDLTYSLSVTVGELTTAGTYPLGGGNSHAANAIVSTTTGGWGTGFTNGTGTVTFTTLTATHAVGTFSFDATPGSGTASGTVHVTNGAFDVTY